MSLRTFIAMLLVFVMLALPGSGSAAPAPELVLQVDIGSSPPEYKQRRVRLSRSRTVVIELDLGEELGGQPVWLAAGASHGTYRVLERYRTSMTVMGEGPHVDLVDWRHHDSAWQSMATTTRNHFVSRVISDREESLFPRVSRREMQMAVDSRARRTWPAASKLVRQCSGPTSYPCAVGVSSRYFRVQRRVSGNWVGVGDVEVRLPMGC